MSIRKLPDIWRTSERAPSSDASSTTTAGGQVGNEVAGISLECRATKQVKSFMRYNLEKGVVRVGRVRINEEVRPGEALYSSKVMSRDHAIISFSQRGGVYITDTGSTHGSSILRHGLAIPLTPGSRRRLASDDILVLGKAVMNDGQTTKPQELKVRLVYHPFIPDLDNNSSPNRYMIPVNVGDTSESESEEPPSARPSIPIPSRLRNSVLKSPSPLRTVLPMPPSLSRNTSIVPASNPLKRPKFLDEFMDQIECVKEAIVEATEQLNEMRLKTNQADEEEKTKKYEDIQALVSGFQEQQEKISKDHEEQMALIRRIQQEMSRNIEDEEGKSVPRTELKRKASDANLDDAERNSPTRSRMMDQPPNEGDSDIPGMNIGSRPTARRRQRRLALPSVTGTLSTVGTLGLGAAMMWYGLSELPL